MERPPRRTRKAAPDTAATRRIVDRSGGSFRRGRELLIGAFVLMLGLLLGVSTS
jgi:hypothetical protein